MSVVFDESIELADNAMLKVRPGLFNEWNFEKNNELGLNVYKVTKSSGKKAWWICPKCKSGYDSAISHRNRGQKCPYCAGKKVNHTNSLASLNPELARQWHPSMNGDLTSHDVTCGNSKKAWWACELGHEWVASICNRIKGSGCPYCANKKVLKGYNDLWTTKPELASLLTNPEDGYKFTCGSDVKADWRCSSCSAIIKDRAVSAIKENYLKCRACSSSTSYPETIMISLLKYLNVEFNHDIQFDWSKGKRYDFYIPTLNLIIETHGRQHYEQGFSTLGGKTLLEELENDRYKIELAMANGIKDYVVIDCRFSEMEYIKSNILDSELKEKLGIKESDFINMDTYNDNEIVKSWDLWNDYLTVGEISEELNISKETVYRYLKRGKSLGKCDYSVKESRKRSSPTTPVVKLDLNYNVLKEYESIRDADRNNLTSKSSIKRACKRIGGFTGSHRWMFKSDYDEYIKNQNFDLGNFF